MYRREPDGTIETVDGWNLTAGNGVGEGDHLVVEIDQGEVVELRCTYDPATRGGDSPDGRKVKGTLHWLSAAHAVPAEIVDEGIREGTTVETLGNLQPAFKEDGKITAGNSSQISDGASAVLVMSEDKAEELGLTPRARLHSFAVVGTDPVTMLKGPIPATRKILEKTGLTLEQMERIENIYRAFTRQVPNSNYKIYPEDKDIQNLWQMGTFPTLDTYRTRVCTLADSSAAGPGTRGVRPQASPLPRPAPRRRVRPVRPRRCPPGPGRGWPGSPAGPRHGPTRAPGPRPPHRRLR